MRAHDVKAYDSVLQVLSGNGCPLCAFLKNVQTKLVQEGEVAQFVQLCNAHAWAVAAVRETETAARVFLALLETRSAPASHECSICLYLEQEEVLRTQELIAALDRKAVVDWLRTHGAVCLPHGLRLQREAPISARALIDRMLDRRASELQNALAGLLAGAAHGDTGQSGVLGRAAEYLVAQRGISPGWVTHGSEHAEG